jgi:broad specificity phosphatase PhoE
VLALAMQALADIALVEAHGTAVVVSHDAVNRAVLAAVDPSLGRPARLVQPTGCFNLLRREAGSWAVVAVDVVP